MHLQLHASLIVDPAEGKHPVKVGAMDSEFQFLHKLEK
jgi:hypothetical protein